MLRAIDTINDDFPTTIEAGPFSPPFREEVVVLSDVGSLSSCDVWFTVPRSWLGVTLIRVYARVGRARVLVREASLDSVATTSVGDLRSGIAVSLRGRPCRCFEVSLYADDADLVGGYFYLQAWHGGAEIAMTPGDDPAPGVSVTARLQGRDAVSGAFVDVVTDDEGRLLVDNPLLGDDFLRLPDVTAVPAPTADEVRVYNDGGVLFAAPPDAASWLAIKVPKRTGTGANAGIPLVVASQDGRNVTSGSNNDGGSLTLSAGDVGAGGTGSSGRGGSLILQVGSGGSSHGTLDLDMATAISNASPKTRWLLDGSEFASLQRERVSGFDYTYIRSASGLFCEAATAAIVKASSVTFDIGAGNTIVAMDASAKPRLTQTLGNASALTAGETVTSFQVNHAKLSGTGAVVGATLQIKAQDGQNGTGTQPNSGGILSLESGAKGASTENAFDGNVVIKTGSTTRVTVQGSGAAIQTVSTKVTSSGANGLSDEPFADVVLISTPAPAGMSRMIPRTYTKTTVGTAVTIYTDSAVPTNSAILYKFTVIGRATSGTDSGKCLYETRHALVDRDAGAPVRDTVFDIETEQRVHPDSATAAVLLIAISGNNVVLNVTPPSTSTWHWLVWGERIVLTP